MLWFMQLVEVAANSTSLKELTCSMNFYEQLQSCVPKQYQYILYDKLEFLMIDFVCDYIKLIMTLPLTCIHVIQCIYTCIYIIYSYM